MKLGMFSMPLHDPAKPWGQALEEDRQAVILADKLGFSEAWIGEHFASKAEQIPSPMMFLATVIHETAQIRLGTGVVNMSHHNPAVVAAEAAMFDHLSGGRLLLGVGPGGLSCDAELFGREDIPTRGRMLLEAIGMMQRLWAEKPPLRIEGEFWTVALERNIWERNGLGVLTRPLQQPHPPMAMAMVSPGGRTAETIAELDFIPISSNFVPAPDVAAQWRSYAAKRQELGKVADPAIWRVCRSVLVTESARQAQEMLDDPEGVFGFYFQYLRSTRRIGELREFHTAPVAELHPRLGVAEAVRDCIIAGTEGQVLDQLVAMVDQTGPFGTLVMTGHDWDGTGMWQDSMRRLAENVMPRLGRHMDQLPVRAAE